MQGEEFPKGREGMETRICCAYNLSRGCSISSSVTVADSVLEPLKVLKTMVGLAIDAKSGLWLTPLLHTPTMTRLFPFDLVYLDADLRVIEEVELVPEASFPQFNREVTSALIVPLHTLAFTGTGKGDQLLICTQEELAIRLAEISAQQDLAAVAASAAESAEAIGVPLTAALEPKPAPNKATGLPVSVPIRTGAVTPGTGFTVSLTTTWQLTSSTMPTVVPEVEAGEQVAAIEDAAIADAPVAETEDADAAVEDSAADGNLSVADTLAVDTEVVEERLPTSAESDSAGIDRVGPVGAPRTVPQELKPPDLGGSCGTAEVHPMDMDPSVGTPEAVPFQCAEASEAQAPEPVGDPAAEAEVAESVAEEQAAVDVSPAVTPEALQPETTHAPDAEDNRPSEASLSADNIVSENVESAANVETEAPVPEVQPPAASPQHAKEVVQSAPAVIPPPKRTTPKTKPREKKKDPLGVRVIRWLNLEDPPPERRAIIRLLLQGLQAYDANGNRSKLYDVRDVCPPGFYLRTEEKWPAGEVVSLVLERKGATESDHEGRVSVRARVVRCDEDGIGLEFVFPEGTEFQPWQRVKKTKRSDETEADFILKELRLARALGFLRRLSPGAAEEIRHALHDRLSNKRVASAVEIALKAECSLARNGSADGVLAHPEVVMRAIETGSWIEDDWIRRMWAGLLVSSCSTDGQDKSNLTFMDLLAKLNPIHLRIFTFVCHKAAEAIKAGESEAALELYSTAEELMTAADSHSFARIQQAIGQLSGFGLLKETTRPSYVSLSGKEKTRTVPTALGLKMYACCNGVRS